MGYTAEGIAESSILALICILAIIGNSSLFIVVFTNSSLRTISNYYVLSLSAADLMITVVSGPVTAFSMLKGEWVLGKPACSVFGFITLLTFVASVCNLAMIALNRYFYIVGWKTYKRTFRKTKAFQYGICVWLISFLLSLPPLVGWSDIRFINAKSYCFVNWPSDVYYMYFMVCICFFGPLTIMIICYYKILNFTKSLKKRLFKPSVNLPGTSRQRKENKLVSQEELKLTNTLLIVVACFVICWAPFAITMFFDVYYSRSLPRPIHVISLCLGYLNSMCNPILYGVRSSNFRKGFNNLYFRCFPCILKKNDLKSFISTESENGKQCSTLSKNISQEVDNTHESLTRAFYSKVSPTFSDSSENNHNKDLRHDSIEQITSHF